jgi:D-glycero-alpha-D-manno-heptose 1-phosphate guanylyltransferase
MQNSMPAFNEKQYCKLGLINGGVYIINRSNCRMVHLPDKFSFETDILQQHVINGNLFGFVNDNYFIDIGIPKDYAKANIDFKNLF